jgi:hypothetical protein
VLVVMHRQLACLPVDVLMYCLHHQERKALGNFRAEMKPLRRATSAYTVFLAKVLHS